MENLGRSNMKKNDSINPVLMALRNNAIQKEPPSMPLIPPYYRTLCGFIIMFALWKFYEMGQEANLQGNAATLCEPAYCKKIPLPKWGKRIFS